MYSGSQILAVTNRHLCPRPLEEQIPRICSLRPRGIILREKDLPEKEYLDLAEKVLAICRSHQVLCILHSWPDAAARLGCSAIHLPLPLLQSCQGKLSDFTVIGTSVHSPEEAREGEALGATYLTAGHIYATDCKKGVPPRGTDFLREVCRSTSLPVYAIGGIRPDPEQFEEILSCGARGGCMMSQMMQL
ncbi:MAG: thiamine phosphate synthase [Lachnospiraceae bacterium]|nr:thiamine phosphate synthase [Lachnospiraceae bacterium]